MDICVVVQGVPNRGLAWERSKASIEASDIVSNYFLMLNPEGMDPSQHFLNILEWMWDDESAEWFLRLEDDAIVNKYILHNLKTWPDIREENFGAGWLLTPNAPKGSYNQPRLHCAVGVLLRRDHLEDLIDRCENWFDKHGTKGCPQDLALSESVWNSDKRIYIHDPPLVEHPIDVPSILGHVHRKSTSTSNGRFDLEWRRKS